ncbi:serine/threonine-protein phosphatase 4 regulatory subunit 2 [Sipha flava]|jgi:serine/threonine-protein phosphatase 4 regulatory subunit 2|uniref:Serine/threonine-protein phosphatase 4 regulatory subunit 2 n=1 Tax=Sipha flava TaxID=143950 RepID=A0A2S2PVT2_9HEMI|nr:serine/threonine-protein phosphatase 4 regulatory subunit 2 [Sipha flava]
MIENAELVMQMLEMYQMYKQQVPVELEEYLRYVAKTGNTLFQWSLVKPFIREKILNVIAEFADQSALADIPPYPNVDPFNYEAMKTMLLERFDTFNGPPFTIQRLCELLSCPRKEYNRVDKFMRAVEKNILVVSTCELRSKHEDIIVNGVPDHWENGKESDITMDLVDKSNVVSDINVLNGNETVESLLNELESMKTPETKQDEIKTELKDHIVVAEVPDEVEQGLPTEQPTQDIPQIVITEDTPPQIIESTEEVEKINTDFVEVIQESMVDLPKEQISEVCEIQPVVVKEQPNSVEEQKEISYDINLEVNEPNSKEPIIEGNNLDHSELTSTDADRIEGSIIHQTPDSENNVELDTAASQSEILSDKSKKGIENMDVQIEEISKCIKPEIKCDNIQKENTEPTGIDENDKEQDDASSVDVNLSAIDTISTKMDIELDKIENDLTQQEVIPVNEETEAVEPKTILEAPQEKDENKLTEIE